MKTLKKINKELEECIGQKDEYITHLQQWIRNDQEHIFNLKNR